MPDHLTLATWLGGVVICAPALLVLLLGLSSLIDQKLSERAVSGGIQLAVISGLLASFAILAIMLLFDNRHLALELGDWVEIPHYHFSVKFVFDRLSVPLLILSYVLCGTVGAFAVRYMHREPGFHRFFVLYAVFFVGMILTSLAGTIETLFAGWEMVGLSSALLVAFFHDRVAPVANGFRVWSVYRLSDAALLLAAVVLHHLSGEGDFDRLCGFGVWPAGEATITHDQALVVGGLLLFAAAGKSALVPFSGWLPRAMEGPTPSSAVFYGALSVHLGAYLLLRVSPILECSIWLQGAVVVLGLTTAMFASLAGSVQTDIKSALSFASLAQVGLIVAEIGFGLYYLALVHLLGHACLRTLQFLRAPTLLQDYRVAENALGERLPRPSTWWGRFVAPPFRAWLYRLALERGYLDSWLTDYVAKPFLRVFHRFEKLERRWTCWLSGETKPLSEQAEGKR